MVENLWARDDKLAWLTARGLTEETIAQASLGYIPENGDPKFSDCIAIPYHDARGELVTVRFRHLRANPPRKYDAAKGSRRHLYNVRATDEATVVICEGEFDALIVQQLGLAAVALPGVNAWQREWRFLFRNADQVYVAIDHARAENEDALKAETRARGKIAAHVGMVVPEVETIRLPEGMDVTDLYLKDPDHLRGLLS